MSDDTCQEGKAMFDGRRPCMMRDAKMDMPYASQIVKCYVPARQPNAAVIAMARVTVTIRVVTVTFTVVTVTFTVSVTAPVAVS